MSSLTKQKRLDRIQMGDRPDRNREFKYYRLTTAGKRQLLAEESKWKQLASAVARVMWPAEENVT